MGGLESPQSPEGGEGAGWGGGRRPQGASRPPQTQSRRHSQEGRAEGGRSWRDLTPNHTSSAPGAGQVLARQVPALHPAGNTARILHPLPLHKTADPDRSFPEGPNPSPHSAPTSQRPLPSPSQPPAHSAPRPPPGSCASLTGRGLPADSWLTGHPLVSSPGRADPASRFLPTTSSPGMPPPPFSAPASPQRSQPPRHRSTGPLSPHPTLWRSLQLEEGVRTHQSPSYRAVLDGFLHFDRPKGGWSPAPKQ